MSCFMNVHHIVCTRFVYREFLRNMVSTQPSAQKTSMVSFKQSISYSAYEIVIPIMKLLSPSGIAEQWCLQSDATNVVGEFTHK